VPPPPPPTNNYYLGIHGSCYSTYGILIALSFGFDPKMPVFSQNSFIFSKKLYTFSTTNPNKKKLELSPAPTTIQTLLKGGQHLSSMRKRSLYLSGSSQTAVYYNKISMEEAVYLQHLALTT
jgi:hypothetical protein